MYEAELNERRNRVLRHWPAFLEDRAPRLISEVVERSKTELPDDFVPWAPGAVIASDYLLRASGCRPGSRRPKGWSQREPDVFRKRVNGNTLTVSGCGEFWTIERENAEALAFIFGPLPVFTRTSQEAMRLAEYCQPRAQQ